MDWLVAVDGLAPLDHFNAMLPRTWGVRTEDCVSKTHSYIYCTVGYVSQYSSSDCCCCRSPTHLCTLTRNDALSTRSNIFLFATSPLDRLTIKAMSKSFLLAERGFDPRTSGLWAQHASTAPLCYHAEDTSMDTANQQKYWFYPKIFCVRSGIRTHAHRSGLRPERSALDHSAILTL